MARCEVSQLLDDVLDAYGGAERWRSVSSIIAAGHVKGLLPRRFPGTKLANVTFNIDTAGQRTVIDGFPTSAQRAIFDEGAARIQTLDGHEVSARSNPREAFFGPSG